MSSENNKSEKSYSVHTTENFNTLIFDLGGKQNQEFKSAARTNLVDLLTHPDHRKIREDVLNTLREKNGKELLIQVLDNHQKHPAFPLLVAACWESGIDFSDRIEYFIDLSIAAPFEVSIEALSVIEEMRFHLVDPLAGVLYDKTKAALASHSGKPKEFVFSQILLHLDLLSNKTGE